ncbi:hypothetical protein Tco_1485099 [Tanacetum coccineum]
MSDSDESRVTHTEISSPYEDLSDIGSPRADDHEFPEPPYMLEDPYFEAAHQAPPSQTISIGIDIPVRLGLTLVKQIQFHLSQITGVLGIKNEDAISMSNSEELRHTDNTTLVPPRLPDTLPQVYHRRRPTLGLLILPSVSPFPPTIRRTARISIPPIEPNLAERARISAVNLDDYQLDPLTPPPSPSSPFTMAAYQRMIAETDPTQREEALTETGQNSVPVPETALTVCTTRLRGQLHTILEDMDRYPNACLEELEAFMTLWDVKPRVEESSLETLSVDELITQLRQMCEDAEDRASNAQEEARQKRKEALEEVVQQIYRTNN